MTSTRPLQLKLGHLYYVLPIFGHRWLLWIRGRVTEALAWDIRDAFGALPRSEIDAYCALWPTAPNAVMADWLEDHGMPRGWRKIVRPEPKSTDPADAIPDTLDPSMLGIA